MKYSFFDWMPSLAYVLLAMSGGIARYLHSYTHGAKFHWGVFSANAVLSGFSGYIFALVATSMQMPDNLTFVFAGVGGFLGHSGLEWLSEVIKSKINANSK